MGYLIILLSISALLCWKFWPRESKPPVQVETKPDDVEQQFVIDPPIEESDAVAEELQAGPLDAEPADVATVTAPQEIALEPVVTSVAPEVDKVVDSTAHGQQSTDEQIPADSADPVAVPQDPLVVPADDPAHEPVAEPVKEPAQEPVVEVEATVDAVPEVATKVETTTAEPIAELPVEVAEPTLITQPVEPVVDEPKPFEPPLLILIDDSVVVRTKLTRTVSAAGYRTLGAGDGVQGLKLIESDTPALVITDIEMPEMDGFQLIDHLNQNQSTCNIPVIAISGHEGIKAQLTQFPNVVDAFKKPWDSLALLARLEELVGPGQAPEA